MDIKRLRKLAGTLNENFVQENEVSGVDAQAVIDLFDQFLKTLKDEADAGDDYLQGIIYHYDESLRNLIGDATDYSDDNGDDDDVAFTGRDSMSYMNDR